MSIQNKQQAISYITDLMDQYDINFSELKNASPRSPSNEKSRNVNWLTYIMGYLGAAFIFSGLVMFTAMIWDDLNSFSRVFITYGSGLTALILGIITLKDGKFIQAATPLFLMSAALLPTGMFVFLAEYGRGGDAQLASIIIFSILAIQYFTTFKKFSQTSLLFFAALFWFNTVGLALDYISMPGELIGIIIGFSVLVFGWYVDKTPYNAIAPFNYFVGGFILSISAFELCDEYLTDLLYLPVVISMIIASVMLKSRALLIVSTISLLGYLGYFTEQYFANVTGWPLALMCMGVLMIVISAYAVKLGKKISYNH